MKWFPWVLPAVLSVLLPSASHGQEFDLRVINDDVRWPVNKSEKPRREEWWLVQRLGDGRGATRVTVTFHAPFCAKQQSTEGCDHNTWSQKVEIRPIAGPGAWKLSPPYYLLNGPGDWKAAGRAELTGHFKLSEGESTVAVSIGDKRHVISRTLSDDKKKVTVTVGSGAVVQEVYACQTGGEAYPFCGDEGFEEILWAGDLDGDNRLDFIAQFTQKYSIRNYHLYMSKGAGNGELVRLATKYLRYGD